MDHDATTDHRGPNASSLTWASRLREVGLRVTKQRLAVLNTLDQHQHATADEILDQVRIGLPEITVQSVYTVLNSLLSVGLLRKLVLADSPARYETRIGDNHHHAVCDHCGRIEDVTCSIGHAPCLHPSQDHGMLIEVADVVYHGLCLDCREAQPAKTAPG